MTELILTLLIVSIKTIGYIYRLRLVKSEIELQREVRRTLLLKDLNTRKAKLQLIHRPTDE